MYNCNDIFNHNGSNLEITPYKDPRLILLIGIGPIVMAQYALNFVYKTLK